MTEHDISAHFEVACEASTQAPDPVASLQHMLIERCANAYLGGTLGADLSSDMVARQHAAEFVVMYLEATKALVEAGIIRQ